MFVCLAALTERKIIVFFVQIFAKAVENFLGKILRRIAHFQITLKSQN